MSNVTLASRVLPDLSAKDAEIAALKAQIAALAAKQSSPGKLTLKVSEKGALSIYGLGRWPITLYLSQFRKVAAQWDDITAFVEANASRFTEKE